MFVNCFAFFCLLSPRCQFLFVVVIFSVRVSGGALPPPTVEAAQQQAMLTFYTLNKNMNTPCQILEFYEYLGYKIYRETQNVFSVITDLHIGIDIIMVWPFVVD